MQDAVKQRVLPFALCAISLGLGIFCGAAGARSQRGQSVEPEPQVAPTAEQAATDDSTVKVLRARIRELETQLTAKADVTAAAAPKRAENREDGQTPRDRRRTGEWMKELKEKHPERYVAITNGMANFRRHQTAEAQSKIDFLSSIDPSSLGPEAKAVHERLQELIARREELSERMMQNFENQTEEDVRDNFRRQGELMHEIRELSQQERDNLVQQLANNLGFKDEDAGEIVATVKQIIEATENNFGPPPRGREARPPRGERPRP